MMVLPSGYSVFKVLRNRSDKVPLLTSSVERPVFHKMRKIYQIFTKEAVLTQKKKKTDDFFIDL